MASPEHTALLLTNDVARILGVSPETVRLLERLGRLPALKTERGVRLFDRRDVERLAREREERRTSRLPAVPAGALA
jgi:excisionase family DNA binding protein